MWCTRWFLPLLLLPLPTAPPFFLALFLISLTLHSKPCFYCILLLTTLFLTSCYWQPFPIDSELSVPWSDNITTFSEALNASLPKNYSQPLPSVIRAIDRCWCDFSNGLFEPFNVSRWERMTVMRLKTDLERQQTAWLTANSTEFATNTTSVPEPSPRWFRRFRFRKSVTAPPQEEEESTPTVAEPAPAQRSPWEVDLRPYGLGIVVDFGWSRQ